MRAAGRTVYMDLRESVWQYLALIQERSDMDGLHPCIPKDMLERVIILLGEHGKPKDVSSTLSFEYSKKIMSQCKRWLTSLLASVKGDQRDSKHRRRIVLTLTRGDYGNPDEVCVCVCACVRACARVSACDYQPGSLCMHEHFICMHGYCVYTTDST